MTIQILKGYSWGVDKETVAAGSGAGAAPQVVSAASTAPDRVRVTFNQAMDEVSIGKFRDYRIVGNVSGIELGVVGAIPVSDTVVDLITDGQFNALYDLTVTRVRDVWDVPINNLANNTAQFAGTDMSTLFPSASSKTTFYGLESGMQGEGHPSFNPDLTAPILQNQNPAPSAPGVLQSSNVYLEIVDALNNVNALSVVIEIAGTPAWQNDAAQPGFSVAKSPVAGGFSYDINPDTNFTSHQVVVVHVIAEDNAPIPNEMDTSYSFTTLDNEPPYLSAQDPFPSETGVSPITRVKLRVNDDGIGVDPATVTIVIDGDTAWASGALQAGFNGTGTPFAGGIEYDLQRNIPLPPLSTIDVDVLADDFSANSLNTTYSFDTALDLPPEFENLDPEENASGVSPNKVVSFDIVDNVAVDPTKTLIFVDGLLAYESEVAENGFSVVRTPVTFGFRYKVTPPTGWAFGTDVVFDVTARDTLNTLGQKAWTFAVAEDPTCFAGPLNETEEALLVPFTSLDHTERLRKTLLLAATTKPDAITAARVVYMNGHSQELAPVLRDMVATPTTTEKAARLCNRATHLAVSNTLRRKINLLPGAIRELQGLGLPREHVAMLNAYAAEDQPNTEVPLACLIVLLAKALE
jgi:hypothetical protein